jgi:hypothetical protein
MPATYEPIATTTLGSAASTITFSSIAGTYTDLRLLVVPITSAAVSVDLRFNNSSSAIYSWTNIQGNGSSAASASAVSNTKWTTSNATFTNTTPSLITLDLFSYAGSTNKTGLCTFQNDRNGAGSVERSVGLFALTAAITEIKILCDLGGSNFSIGTTATLYGIKNA